MATSCIASTASVRNPPMTKSTLSCVSARSMALVASGTLCISFESTLTISIGCFWLPTLIPPALLISSLASSAPAQWFSPWTKAIGPMIPIFMGFSAACVVVTIKAAAADTATRTARIRRRIFVNLQVINVEPVHCTPTIDVTDSAVRQNNMAKAVCYYSRLRIANAGYATLGPYTVQSAAQAGVLQCGPQADDKFPTATLTYFAVRDSINDSRVIIRDEERPI